MAADSSSPLILLCSGGTGGHMFPAKALAEELLSRGFRVALATDTRGRKYFAGIEDRVPCFLLSSAPYRPGLAGKWILAVSLLRGYLAAHRLITRMRPAVAVGFGGYPSVPGMLAAQHRRIPTLIHEQNAILGMANALLSPLSARIALSLPETAGIKPGWRKKTVITGNPVRRDIAALSAVPYPSLAKEISLFIIGGSQGATVFSKVIPPALLSLPDSILSRLRVVQQARAEDVPNLHLSYQGSGIQVEIKPFFDDVPDRLRTAHLLIARSGASTVAEATAAGRPAIYVPFPWNRDGQQILNAQRVVAAGGARMILEKDMDVDTFRSALLSFLENPDTLPRAAAAAKALGLPEAAAHLADCILSLLKGKVCYGADGGKIAA